MKSAAPGLSVGVGFKEAKKNEKKDRSGRRGGGA